MGDNGRLHVWFVLDAYQINHNKLAPGPLKCCAMLYLGPRGGFGEILDQRGSLIKSSR